MASPVARNRTDKDPIAPPGTPYSGQTPEELLHAEQIKLLYASLPAAIIVNVLLALIFAGVEHAVIASDQLLGWLALLGIVLLARAGLFTAWKLARASAQKASSHWLWRFRIGTMATGIAWGIGSVLHPSSVDIIHHVYALFILAGLTAGAITYLSIDLVSALGFLLPALCPPIIRLATYGNAISLTMSAAITLFLLFLVTSTKRTGALLRDNIKLRIQAFENESHLRFILENSPVATRIASLVSDRVVFANKRYAELIESEPERVIGSLPRQYYADPQVYTDVLEQIAKGKRVSNRLVELSIRDKQTTKWALASYLQIEYQDKPAVLGWFYDITDRKMMEEQVKFLANHDPLTRLPNRNLFGDRLQHALALAKREQISLALMFLDLDGFKPVNDEYGHDIGDLLLQKVAERIQGCLRDSDTVARIGGDEFIILLPSIKTEQDALRVAEKIHQALNQPCGITGITLDISSSIGIAMYPDHGRTGQQLIKHADTAMYHAKVERQGRVKAFRPEMQELPD